MLVLLLSLLVFLLAAAAWLAQDWVATHGLAAWVNEQWAVVATDSRGS